MLSHPNEPFLNEDLVTVNVEHIRNDAIQFPPGLFASYHVYPYYPDSMKFQHDHLELDEQGNVDTYRAYLKDLKSHHTLPVVIAEFGIPSSRGMAHRSAMGFNQGNVGEQKQGEYDVHMLQDIHQEGYAGALVFSWQDEWFKRTWNTMDLELPDRRPYWSNAQTNEQSFGLLAFDPGKRDVCQVDGSIGEWKGSTPVHSGPGVDVFVKSDEKYLYLLIKAPEFDSENDVLLVPLDTIPQQGNFSATDYSANFTRAADFLLVLGREGESRLLVDAYYDSFYYRYAKQASSPYIDPDPAHEVKNGGRFVPMNLLISKPLYLPQDQTHLPLEFYETGLLKLGDSNPRHRKYDSLADYHNRQGRFEVRIPWQLLNVMDPSTKMVMGDFYTHVAIEPLAVDGIFVGAGILKPAAEPPLIDMGPFSWQPWDLPSYHERLKPSYYLLKRAFADFH